MKRLSTQKGKRKSVDQAISGTARTEYDAAKLARRLRRGEIAIVDVLDLDRATAELLVTARPAAVLNAQESISGRFPSGGAQVLVEAGVPLVDSFGQALLAVRDGVKVRIDGADVYVGDNKVATGLVQTGSTVAARQADAVGGMRTQLASFTAGAMDHVERDHAVLLDGAGLPDVEVDFEGKQVVVIGPGFEHEELLKSLRGYLRDRRPAIIAVGTAADAAMKHAYPPALIVGDIEGVSEEALTSGATIVLHAGASGGTGASRLDSLKAKRVETALGVSSVDLALLLAHHGGASVIATVGVPADLVSLVEQGSEHAGGTFLARLVAGEKIVDAATLAQVYRYRYSPWTLVALLLAALFAVANAVWLTPGGSAWLKGLWPDIEGWFGG